MKNTDKITLTVKQLKTLVNEAATITETYLIVYDDTSSEIKKYYKTTINASSIFEALNEFMYKIGNKNPQIEILKIEKLY